MRASAGSSTIHQCPSPSSTSVRAPALSPPDAASRRPTKVSSVADSDSPGRQRRSRAPVQRRRALVGAPSGTAPESPDPSPDPPPRRMKSQRPRECRQLAVAPGPAPNHPSSPQPAARQPLVSGTPGPCRATRSLGRTGRRRRWPSCARVRSMHHRVDHMTPAPVVSDEVDGFTDLFQLVDEPITIGEKSRRKRARQRGAESRRDNRTTSCAQAHQQLPDRVFPLPLPEPLHSHRPQRDRSAAASASGGRCSSRNAMNSARNSSTASSNRNCTGPTYQVLNIWVAMRYD